jgi:valyl-tRNA synthetase
MKPSDLAGADVWVISRLHELIDSVTSATLSNNKKNAIEMLRSFLEDEFLEFFEESCKKRVEEKEPSALFTVYVIGIVCLKLASALMPSSAEEIYQKYYRNFEGEPSIHLVMWPEIVMHIIG